MEEILKIGEFGAMALVTGYLLTRGTSALKDLAESNKNLANAVEKLSEKVNTLDNRTTFFDSELRDIKADLAELKRNVVYLLEKKNGGN